MKRHYIIIFILLNSFLLCGQFFKNFDLEVANNFSVVFNKGKFNSGRHFYVTDSIKGQSPAYFLNYNVSLGYSISKKSSIRIKYGRNNVGAKLTGSSTYFGDIVPSSTLTFNKSTNIYKVTFIGLHYQYQLPLLKDYLLLSIGVDRQNTNGDEALVRIKDFASPNYALEASVGYQWMLLGQFSVIGRSYVINAFSKPNSFYSIVPPSSFSPIQYGLEFAIRKDF